MKRHSFTALACAGALLTGAAVAAEAARTVPQAAESYNWSEVNVHGGGWVTGMVVGRNGEVYSRTDVGGAYRWDETAKRWHQLITATGVPGPHGSDFNVESLNLAPSNAQVLYAAVGGALNTARGRILRSADAGRTWRHGTQRFKIHGNGDHTFYALGGNNANGNSTLWKTTNGGATWNKVAASGWDARATTTPATTPRWSLCPGARDTSSPCPDVRMAAAPRCSGRPTVE